LDLESSHTTKARGSLKVAPIILQLLCHYVVGASSKIGRPNICNNLLLWYDRLLQMPVMAKLRPVKARKLEVLVKMPSRRQRHFLA
jgi:hypothetical protein